jgi:hypothetical protein
MTERPLDNQDPEAELTPPDGDDLRDESTFGRTDRYANLDDEDATREQAEPKPNA